MRTHVSNLHILKNIQKYIFSSFRIFTYRMVHIILMLLLGVIAQTFSQDIHSLMLFETIDRKYSCTSVGCSPSAIVIKPSSTDCTFACLTYPHCHTLSFDLRVRGEVVRVVCEGELRFALLVPYPHPQNFLNSLSDGATAYFKNNTSIPNLVRHRIDFSLDPCWTFAVTRHGKG